MKETMVATAIAIICSSYIVAIWSYWKDNSRGQRPAQNDWSILTHFGVLLTLFLWGLWPLDWWLLTNAAFGIPAMALTYYQVRRKSLQPSSSNLVVFVIVSVLASMAVVGVTLIHFGLESVSGVVGAWGFYVTGLMMNGGQVWANLTKMKPENSHYQMWPQTILCIGGTFLVIYCFLDSAPNREAGRCIGPINVLITFIAVYTAKFYPGKLARGVKAMR